MAKQLTDIQREKIMADYHVGKSQNFLAKKYECSTATINKLCKGVVQKNVENVNTLTRIETEIAAQSEYEVNAIRSEVEEKTAHIQFFNHAAITNVKQAMQGPCVGQNDYKARADTISKGRADVLGKTADTNVQVNTGVHLTISSQDACL